MTPPPTGGTTLLQDFDKAVFAAERVGDFELGRRLRVHAERLRARLEKYESVEDGLTELGREILREQRYINGGTL